MDDKFQTQHIQEQESNIPEGYIKEDGKLYRMPYKIIKKITFNDLNQKELIDIAHCARLQYRLLNLDAVIKAKVSFVKKQIQIIYNNLEADNNKAKINRNELIKFIEKEGLHIKNDKMIEENYDYYKEFYSSTFFPKSIRNALPYGWSKEEYEKIKANKK
ncbi:MAG: hypothetical protein M1538_02385 [Candidatus Marsarchaeota archaeon]|jgi:hypothetical protein|nr:hypothetical protein [Candidatus Marsarchaeota archaeon]